MANRLSRRRLTVFPDPFRVEGKPFAEQADLFPDPGQPLFVADILEHSGDEPGDQLHLRLLHPPRGQSGRSDADAAGDLGPLGVERNPVLVDRDARPVERLLRLFPRNAQVGQVHEHQVVVGAARDEAEAVGQKGIGEGLRVFQDLALILFELLREGLLEGHRLGGDDVHQGAALHSRKDFRVQGAGELLFAEDESAAGAAEGLVGGHGDELAAGHRGGVQAGGDEAADVGDVGQNDGSDGVGDGPELLVVDRPGVGARADDDDLRAVLPGQGLNLVEVDGLRFPVHPVENAAVKLAREADRTSVGEMAPVGEAHPEDRVPGLEHGEIDGHVGLNARMGLDVGVLRPEKLFAPLDGEALHDVDELAPAVVSRPRIALGVLVGHDAALGLQDSLADEVLRGDHLQFSRLPARLLADRLGDLRVGLHQIRHEFTCFILFFPCGTRRWAAPFA